MKPCSMSASRGSSLAVREPAMLVASFLLAWMESAAPKCVRSIWNSCKPFLVVSVLRSNRGLSDQAPILLFLDSSFYLLQQQFNTAVCAIGCIAMSVERCRTMLAFRKKNIYFAAVKIVY